MATVSILSPDKTIGPDDSRSPARSGAVARKAAVVTGGTDGIGKEIARGLARRGFAVVIVGRDGAKGAHAEDELRASGRNPDIHFAPADLGLAAEAQRLGRRLQQQWPEVHCLVHSAGIVRGRRELTAEGIESNFAVGYLGRFALTAALLPSLTAAGRPGKAARILLVSGAARNGAVDFVDPNLTGNFSTLRAVLQCCHANDLFAVELARRLDGAASGVTVSCLKIGVVRTNIRREFPRWMKILVPLLIDPLLAQSREDAASAALSLLVDEMREGVTGALFLKIAKLRQIRSDGRGLGRDEGTRLWELSERMSGCKFDVTDGQATPAVEP